MRRPHKDICFVIPLTDNGVLTLITVGKNELDVFCSGLSLDDISQSLRTSNHTTFLSSLTPEALSTLLHGTAASPYP